MATLIFDLDGVLVRSRYRNKSFLWAEELETKLGIPSEVRDQLFAFPFWKEALTGKADFRARIEALFSEKQLRATPDEFLSFWLSRDLNWYSEVLLVVEGYRAKGYHLYIASNQDRVRTEFIERQKELQSFDAVLTSAKLGFVKPDTQFFAQATERLGNRSDGVVYIDDDQRNLAAAVQFGWRGVHFDPDLDSSFTPARLRMEIDQRISELSQAPSGASSAE